MITCVTCIVLLLTLCYFGVNNSLKGTQASSGYWDCPNGGTLSDGTCTWTRDIQDNNCGSGYTTVSCKDSGHNSYYCTCSYSATWVSTDDDNEETDGDTSAEESACTSGSACFYAAESYVWAAKSRFCSYKNGTCTCSPQPEALSQAQCKNSSEDDDNDSGGTGSLNWSQDTCAVEGYTWNSEKGCCNAPSSAGAGNYCKNDDNNYGMSCWKCSNGYIYGSESAYKDKCTLADNSYCDSYTNGGNTCGGTDYGYWEQETCDLAGHNWISANKCCQKYTDVEKSGNTCGLEDYNSWTADTCVGKNVWTGDGTGKYCCALDAAIATGNECGKNNFNSYTKDSCTGDWIANDTNGYCCKISSSENTGGGTGGTSGSGSGSSGGNGSSGNNNSGNTGGSTSGGSTTNPDNSNTGTNNGSNNNVNENPQTGQIIVFIVWFVGLAAIVYSGWYFNNLRKSN